ncbi:MAG: HupE/UreJ family protein, partial [Waterburya sp.]
MNKNQAIAFGGVFGVLLAINFFTNTSPALAHHPMGGKLPSNFTEGLLSGLGHPVIGIDHLAFVIAIGLLAALTNRLGMVIPLAFMLTTAVGTLIHLQSIDLPVVELVISASVLLIGILLAQTNQTNLVLLTIISAIAGIFHGYA